MSDSSFPAQPDPAKTAPERMALKPTEAAEALGIGRHKLWELTSRGLLPHVRFGRAVRYPVDGLRRFLADEAKRSTRR